MALAAGLAAPALGVVYGYLVAFNPFIYVNFIATLACAGGIGVLVGKAAKLGKVRNLKLGLLFGLLGGLAFECSQWWATLDYYGLEPVMSQPTQLWAMVQALAEFEPWGIGDSSPSAWGFLGIWGIEAAMIVGGASLVGWVGASDPFCEKCNVWAEPDQVVKPLDFVSDAERFQERVKRGDLSVLTELERIEAAGRFCAIELLCCPQCRELRVAKVKNVELSQDKDGDLKEDETIVVEDVLLDSASYDALAKRMGADA